MVFGRASPDIRVKEVKGLLNNKNAIKEKLKMRCSKMVKKGNSKKESVKEKITESDQNKQVVKDGY